MKHGRKKVFYRHFQFCLLLNFQIKQSIRFDSIRLDVMSKNGDKKHTNIHFETCSPLSQHKFITTFNLLFFCRTSLKFCFFAYRTMCVCVCACLRLCMHTCISIDDGTKQKSTMEFPSAQSKPPVRCGCEHTRTAIALMVDITK